MVEHWRITRWTSGFDPALISTADLFQATNRLVNPNEPDVSVNIRTTRQGSFEVLLKLISTAPLVC